MSLQAIFNCYCKGLRVCLDVLSHFYVSFVAIPFLSCHCFMAVSLVGIRKTGSGEGTLLPIFFPEGGEMSVHRLIFQAQMGKTSISYQFHGAQFFIVKLLTSIDSQLTNCTSRVKEFWIRGKMA